MCVTFFENQSSNHLDGEAPGKADTHHHSLDGRINTQSGAGKETIQRLDVVEEFHSTTSGRRLLLRKTPSGYLA